MMDEELYFLDPPAGIVEMRTTKEQKNKCKEIDASWYAQELHDLVSQAEEQAMQSNQKELNEQFFSPDERKLWHESDLTHWKQWIDTGCIRILLEWQERLVSNTSPCVTCALQNGTETVFNPRVESS